MSRAVEVAASPVYSATNVTAAMRSGVVTVRVHLTSGQARTVSSKSKVGTLPAGARPAVEVTQLFGTKDGAWGMLSVGTDGTVSLYHLFSSSELWWTALDATVSFVAA